MFSISFCLYRACFTHLISSNLSCNLCLWYCDQLVHFDKEINANIYRQYSSTERSNEGNDISVNSNKSYESLNAVGDENVAEMDVVVVSEMAGADAANRGRPLIEVIDEGEAADLSSDGIESFEDFLSSSSLTTLLSEDAACDGSSS